MPEGDALGIENLGNAIAVGRKYQHEFEVDYTDGLDEQFKGTFTVHRPSLLERVQIGVREAQLRGEMDLDFISNNLALMVATLEIVVDVSPNWYQGPGLLFDINVIRMIYNKYMEWLNKFFRKSDAGKVEDSKSTSTKDALDAPKASG